MRIHGVGPTPNAFMIVSDYPGWQEDAQGAPLVGKTGDEVNRYLDGDALPARSRWYLTTLIKTFRREGEYPQGDITRDEPELRQEIHRVQPTTVVTLGRASARWFLGDVNLDEVSRIPWWVPSTKEVGTGIRRDSHGDQDAVRHLLQVGTARRTGGLVVFPIYNPAAGFRNPEIQGQVSAGFTELAAYLRGEIAPRVLFQDAHPDPTYIEITDPRWIASLVGVTDLAIDSEGWPGREWSIQVCVQPGTAYLIRATETKTLRAFFDWLLRARPRVTYHGSLHDFAMMRQFVAQVGLDPQALYDVPFDDTQIMAYLLQLEPIGLKPNCVRHCGMVMQDYADVMGDAQHRLATDYLVQAFDGEQAAYEVRQQTAFEAINRTPLVDDQGCPKRDKQGAIRYRRTTKLPTIPRTDLHKAVERCLRSQRPFDLWQEQTDEVKATAEWSATCLLGKMPLASLDDVPPEVAVWYACRDADGTARLKPRLQALLTTHDLQEVYRAELATYPLIDRMMQIGVKPDLAHFARLSFRLQGELETVQYQLDDLLRVPGSEDLLEVPRFNANSGDQVAEYLYDRLGLPEYKCTPGGRGSTNDILLEGLEQEYGAEYPAISLIRSYRELYKLKSTFVDQIPTYVNRWPYDGRVHATFRTTRVVTGRLAASDPNLLAQPEHGAWADEFKRGWVEDDGFVIGSWDESQIELRVLAHLSQDPVLLAAFRQGLDLHAKLAVRIFGGVEADHKDGRTRLAAKAINFGLPMGMQWQGLMLQLRKNGVLADEVDTKAWLKETNTLYAGVQAYKAQRIAEAQQHGYIRCLSGRIRYIGGIRLWDRIGREEAERLAFSTPVQEGAQWIMKRAEAAVWQVLRDAWRHGWQVEPLLQVHDALKLRMAEGLQDEMHAVMQWAMTEAVRGMIGVPLAVEGKWGRTMADLEKFA